MLPGLTCRPLTLDDVPAWGRLLDRAAQVDRPPSRPSAPSRASVLTAEGFDAGLQSLAGVDGDGELRAVGTLSLRLGDTEHLRLHLVGEVDPAWRGRGVGRALLAWGERVARVRATARRAELGPHVPGSLQVWAGRERDDIARLCAAGGLEPARSFATMRLDLRGGAPAHPVVPDGYRLVRVDEHGTDGWREVHNEVFADHWGSQPSTPGDWTRYVSDNPEFRPGWSFLVLAGAEIAGYAAVHAHEDDWPALGFHEAHLDTLGVRRAHRGHRLARVLLDAVAGRAAQVGMAAVSLDVDLENPSGAVGLYERTGYVPVRGTVLRTRPV